MNDEFEQLIRELTRPINGQYPRPWMTKLPDPLKAKVFIVGQNQAKTYLEADAGSHDRFIDALFNRNGESCRRLYDELTKGKPSPTRRNIDKLTALLEEEGVTEILETNIVCYSTPVSSDLHQTQHRGGRDRGDAIFRALLHWGNPSIFIAHGSGTRNRFGTILRMELPPCTEGIAVESASFEGKRFRLLLIPSLAPPAFNDWHSRQPDCLTAVADKVAWMLNLKPAQSEMLEPV